MLPCQFHRGGPATGEVAEPRDLPLDELARARLYQLNRLREGRLAFEVCANLAIAERLSGLPAPRLFESAQVADLIDKPGGEHLLDAALDTLQKVGTPQVQPHERHLRCCRRRRPL